MTWQPIETAPDDGTDVLVCVTYNLQDGEWETVQWVDWQRGEYVWPHYRGRIDIPFPPTHWMALPEPPESDFDLATGCADDKDWEQYDDGSLGEIMGTVFRRDSGSDPKGENP